MLQKSFLAFVLGTALAVLPVLAAEKFSATATPDAAFTDYFNRCGPGLTGGDSTYSTRISATEVIWLFSDSFIGRVAPDGTRNNDSSQFIQGNTLAVQNLGNSTLTSYLRRTANNKTTTQALPTYAGLPYDTANCPAARYTLPTGSQAMFQPETCPDKQHCYFWGGGIMAEKKHLHAFLQLMVQTGAGAFDFSRHNSAIATLPLKSLAKSKPAYTTVPDNGVSYGGAVMKNIRDKEEKYTYIYGMRAEPAGNSICTGPCLHVARAEKGKLAKTRKWRYWGITSTQPLSYGWTADKNRTVPMAGNTGTASAPKTQDQLGITRMLNCGTALTECYVMIAHQYTGGFTHTIQAWYASQPQGPWTGPVFVYDTPESSQPGQLFTYNAKIHPEFTNESGLLVSYDVNGLAPFTDPLTPFITAASYRPRFIRVKLAWEPATAGHEPEKE